MSKEFDMKIIAEEVSGAMVNPKVSDADIDRELFRAYPGLVGKDGYDKNGNYVPGSAYQAFLVGMSNEIAPRGTSNYFRSLGREFVNSATFSQAKKVAALLISARSGVGYDNVLESLNQDQEQFRQLRGGDAIGASVGGAFTPAPMAVGNMFMGLVGKIPIVGKLLAPAVEAPLLNTVKETTKGGIASVPESALYTAGDSSSFDEFGKRVLGEGVQTAAGTVALTPPLMGVGALAKRGLQATKKFGTSNPSGVSRTANDEGLGIMAKDYDDAGLSQSQVDENFQKIYKTDPALADEVQWSDVAGTPALSTTQGAIAFGGRGRDESVKNIEPFFKKQAQRLKNFTNKILIQAPSVSVYKKKIDAKRKAFGNAYNKLWFKDKKQTLRADSLSENLSVTSDASDELVTFKTVLDPNVPSVQLALKNARQLAAEKRVILKEPEVSGGVVLDATGKPYPQSQAAQEYDPEYLHFLKMGYDLALSKFGEEGLQGAMRAEAIQNQKDLIQLMGKHIKGYDSARINYAEPVSESRAFEEGFNALKNSQSLEKVPEMIETTIENFKGHELEAYKMGAARYLESLIDAGMNPGSVTNKAATLSQFNIIAKVKKIFGEEAGEKINKYMQQHAKMLKERSTVRPDIGSLTQPKQQSASKFDFSQQNQSIPLSGRETLTNLNRPDPEAAAKLSQGVVDSLAPRLTQTGKAMVDTNAADIENWKILHRLGSAGQTARRGGVPSLLSSQSEEIEKYRNPRKGPR